MPGNGRSEYRNAALRVLLIAVALGRSQFAAAKDPPNPKPAAQIPVTQLGYLPQSPSFISARLSTASLDFIDRDHLLLTFRTAGLMKRLPDDPPGDQDQTIHAVVLDLASGLPVRTADWRMHDHGRYLWPLHNGAFLVRQRDTLFLTDSSLELRPYIDSPKPVQAIQPSADGKLLVLQLDEERHSAEEHKKLVQQAIDSGDSPPREDVKIVVMRIDTGVILAQSHADRTVDFPLQTNGYMESLPEKEDHWQLSQVSFDGPHKVLGDIASSCPPQEIAVTPALTLLITCDSRTADHLIQGLDPAGKILWQSWWQSSYIWPSSTGSEDGSRFAFNTLRSTHAVNALDPIEDEDIKGQRVQVFDSASGAVTLTVNASPATASDENYALSPDGKKLAVLTARSIDIYDVPAPTTVPTKPKK